jgi:UDP-N-acetylmuramyl tripeptide synthase
MSPKDSLAVSIGKSVSRVSTLMGIGAGATWPGEIALKISPSLLSPLTKQLRHGVILVVGTNGKTTTSLMLKTILHYEKLRVVYNASGANLLNGLVSACMKYASWGGVLRADWGVFEVDENSLPIVLRYVKPKMIVVLNLFRDQLDRYGEVDVIAEKWQKALGALTSETTLVLNADDPLVASMGKKTHARVSYFGLTQKAEQATSLEHATDSIFCLFCGARLLYHAYYFSHLGDWYCSVCGEKRPELNLSAWESPLPGLYNKYNTLAAALAAQTMGIHSKHIKESLQGFAPAFGRQEERVVNGKTVKLFLSKNPAGYNASLRAVLDMKPRVMLLSLNDRIPDGRDVSWIWDVDFEMIPGTVQVIVTGDRVYDMALRMHYTQNSLKNKSKKMIAEPDVKKSLMTALDLCKKGETLYVLATYSAMLDIRKIVTGRKIL